MKYSDKFSTVGTSSSEPLHIVLKRGSLYWAGILGGIGCVYVEHGTYNMEKCILGAADLEGYDGCSLFSQHWVGTQ